MIHAINGKGTNRAIVVCDGCGEKQGVRCNYIETGAHKAEPNHGQIIRKMEGQGWSDVKGKHYCPPCVDKRKANTAKPEEDMAAKTETALRAPTPKQKREIIALLEIAYDDERKRFRAGESDKTIAEACGEGVLFGWVAQIREELFGPDSRNTEAEALRKEHAKMLEALEALKRQKREMVAKFDSDTAMLESALRTFSDKLDKALA